MKTVTIMSVVTSLWKVKMENCTAWTSQKLVTNKAKAKGEGRVKLTETVSAVDVLVTSEQIAEPELTSMVEPQNLRPKGKVLEIARTKKQRPHKNVPSGTIDLGSFEVLSDHGDEVDVDEATDETTEMMPSLPLDSWFKRSEMFCGNFRKPCNEDHPKAKRIVGMGSKSSLTVCNKWILGHETHRSLYPM